MDVIGKAIVDTGLLIPCPPGFLSIKGSNNNQAVR